MRIVEIPNLINMDTGAPCPAVLSVGSCTVVSFNKNMPYDDGSSNSIDYISNNEIYSVIFTACDYTKFGSPNDEALHGHPYVKFGLGYYGFFEVFDSDLIENLKEIDSHHDRFNINNWKNTRHFILTFHDEMFECVATRFEIRETKGTVFDQTLKIAHELKPNHFF